MTDHMANQSDEAFGGNDYNTDVHWRMRDGSLVEIASMSNDHLRNALRMLDRRDGKEAVDVDIYRLPLISEWQRRGLRLAGWTRTETAADTVFDFETRVFTPPG